MKTQGTHKLNEKEFKVFARLCASFDASTEQGSKIIGEACLAIGMKPEMIIEYSLLLGSVVRWQAAKRDVRA